MSICPSLQLPYQKWTRFGQISQKGVYKLTSLRCIDIPDHRKPDRMAGGCRLQWQRWQAESEVKKGAVRAGGVITASIQQAGLCCHYSNMPS